MTGVGVCGFGRCGSSMMMAMLDAGGLPPIEGSAPVSYELRSLEAALDAATYRHAVKLLDAVLHFDIPAGDWKFIWLDRDHKQQAKSQVKFAEALGVRMAPNAARVFADSYKQDRPLALAALHALGDVLVVNYETVLASPKQTSTRIADFLALDVVPGLMARVVHKRDGRCRPDLAFELQNAPTAVPQ